MGGHGVQAVPPHGTKAAKFDQLLKKGGPGGELKGGVKLPSVFQSSGAEQVLGAARAVGAGLQTKQ